jgi:hypothetical protein
MLVGSEMGISIALVLRFLFPLGDDHPVAHVDVGR